MADVYLVSHNGKLSVSNGTFIYHDADGERRTLFPHLVDRITVVGPMTITAEAMSVMMDRAISCSFLTRGGRFLGSVEYEASKNVFIRQLQYRLLDDKARRLGIARSIVAGKLRNQFRFLQRHMPDQEIRREEGEILHQVQNADSLAELRGYEGIGAHLYFSHIAGFAPTWTCFSGRNSRPPRDPFNAVLSFLYSLLVRRMEQFVHESSLDPAVGVCHELAYGRPSLVCDLIEEFRVPLGDAIAFSLFNRRQLGINDFLVNESESDLPVRMNQNAVRTTVKAFEKKLHEVVRYPLLDLPLPYWKIMKEQVNHYREVLEGKAEEYVPVYFR